MREREVKTMADERFDIDELYNKLSSEDEDEE